MKKEKEFEITKKAEEDINEQVEYYELANGLGSDLKEDVKKTLNRIQQNPLQFQKVKGNTRRALTERFSYGIFYIVTKIKIVVTRVLHTSRNPKEWTKK